MTDVAGLWHLHQQTPFPASCLPLAAGGVPLVKIDAAAGAILTASLRTDGVARRVDESKRRNLQQHRGLIAQALADPALDPEGRAYFERLLALADVVLAVP